MQGEKESILPDRARPARAIYEWPGAFWSSLVGTISQSRNISITVIQFGPRRLSFATTQRISTNTDVKLRYLLLQANILSIAKSWGMSYWPNGRWSPENWINCGSRSTLTGLFRGLGNIEEKRHAIIRWLYIIITKSICLAVRFQFKAIRKCEARESRFSRQIEFVLVCGLCKVLFFFFWFD